MSKMVKFQHMALLTSEVFLMLIVHMVSETVTAFIVRVPYHYCRGVFHKTM